VGVSEGRPEQARVRDEVEIRRVHLRGAHRERVGAVVLAPAALSPEVSEIWRHPSRSSQVWEVYQTGKRKGFESISL
jgi:hypothetical protein